MSTARAWWIDGLAVAVAAVVCVGCGGDVRSSADAGRPRGAATKTKQTSPTPPAETYGPTGTVVGTVRVRGEVPVDPAFARRYEGSLQGPIRRPEGCPPLTDEERRPAHVGADGRTGDVVVTATFSTKIRVAPPPRRNRAIVIRQCRMKPRVLAATRGDTLVIRNEDSYPFMPRVNPIAMGFMQAVLQGQSRRIDLERGGVFEADCGFGAACGVTSIVVLYHGIHGTTDFEGRFRVEGVPANVDVEMHAWHPALRDATRPVRVTPGATATVDFVLEPQPVRAPPPVAPDAGGHPEDRPGVF